MILLEHKQSFSRQLRLHRIKKAAAALGATVLTFTLAFIVGSYFAPWNWREIIALLISFGITAWGFWGFWFLIKRH